MSSRPVRIVVAHRPPLVFVNHNNAETVLYSGMLIDLWNHIVAYSNGTIGPYQYYTAPQNAGGVYNATEGVWNGIMAELVNGHADVALFPLTRTSDRLEAIDCTFSYLDEGLILLVRSEKEDPGPLSVLAPFAMTLWVTLLCTVIGIALLFWALDVYGAWIRRKQAEMLRAAGKLSAKAAERVKRGARSPMIISFAAAAGAPERPYRSSWGVQVLYVVYCFFCLIVLSAYTANLTSFLAVRRASTSITGLQDIARAGLAVAANAGGLTQTYFTSSQDTVAMQLAHNVRFCDSASVCVQWLRSGVVAGYAGNKPNIDYIALQQPCDLTTVGNMFGPGSYVVGLQRNSSLTSLINKAIQISSEDGTLSSLRRAWFDGLSQCNNDDLDLDTFRLTVSQMLGAFVFLAMGVLVAFMTGTIENLKWCIIRASQAGSTSSRMGDQSVRSDRSIVDRLSTIVARRKDNRVDLEQDGHQRSSRAPGGPEGGDPRVPPVPVTASAGGLGSTYGVAGALLLPHGAPGTPGLLAPANSSYGPVLAHPAPKGAWMDGGAQTGAQLAGGGDTAAAALKGRSIAAGASAVRADSAPLPAGGAMVTRALTAGMVTAGSSGYVARKPSWEMGMHHLPAPRPSPATPLRITSGAGPGAEVVASFLTEDGNAADAEGREGQEAGGAMEEYYSQWTEMAQPRAHKPLPGPICEEGPTGGPGPEGQQQGKRLRGEYLFSLPRPLSLSTPLESSELPPLPAQDAAAVPEPLRQDRGQEQPPRPPPSPPAAAAAAAAVAAAATRAPSQLGSVVTPPVVLSRRFRSKWNDEPPEAGGGLHVLDPAACDEPLRPATVAAVAAVTTARGTRDP